MNEKIFFIPRISDEIFKIIIHKHNRKCIQVNGLFITIESLKYYFYNYKEISIISPKELNHKMGLNYEIWNYTNLITLNNYLTKLYPGDKIIVAIHWGGKNYQKHTNELIASNNKLKNGEIYLTHYSEYEDSLKSLDGLVEYASGIWERIKKQPDVKKKLVNLWFPLLIHIRGLCDLEEVERQEYYKKIKLSIDDNYLRMLEDDLLKTSEEMNTSGFIISLETPIKVLEVFAKDDVKSEINIALLKGFADWLNEMNNESNNPR